MDEVPADLNTEDKVEDHLQDHLQDTNGPFPGLSMAYDGNHDNFKSPTSLQMNTWKKGLEVGLQPNSTLVMKALTRSQEEVVPLQNSTLVIIVDYCGDQGDSGYFVSGNELCKDHIGYSYSVMCFEIDYSSWT